MQIALIKSFTDKPWRSPETFQRIEDSLKEKWPVSSVTPENEETLYHFFLKLKQKFGENIFAFNIAEYLDEGNKQGFLPALLEKWKIPHLGSRSRVVTLGLDKSKTSRVLDEYCIPNPQYFVVKPGENHLQSQAESIGYPLIVKPVGEGGHIGIYDDSIVYDDAHLEKAVKRIFDQQDQPALVEEFITGKEMREFSVGVIEGEKRLFTPIEIDFDSMDVDTEILSYEATENDLEKIKLVQDEKTYTELCTLAEKTFLAVGARDYSRVDIRMNRFGYYVLEINIMPGLGPHSFLPESAKSIHSLDYDQLIQKLVEVSIERN